jgi:leucyl aminopeptidase
MSLSVSLVSQDPLTESADALVVCVFGGALAEHPTIRALDRTLQGALLTHAKAQEFEGKAEQVLDVPSLGRLKQARLIVIGAGPEKELSAARLRSVIASGTRVAAQSAKTALMVLPTDDVDLRAVGEGIGLGAYRFTKYFTGDRRPKTELAKLSVSLPSAKPTPALKKTLALGLDVAAAVGIARDAVNEPPNVLYPETLAKLAQKVAQQHQLKIKVLDKKGILAAGMNLHYAVGQGSANEPRFIHITYAPRKKKKKLVFVGKGLTFDSGGLCIKPAPGMGEMKSDMGGAAAVIGLMAAVGTLRPDIEVHGIVGAAENMPDGDAYRPADVFTSLDGKTVEIINTDAEGRLVLADCLDLAIKRGADRLVDVATLTGAIKVALGDAATGVMGKPQSWIDSFMAASREAGENAWQMPLYPQYRDKLKSNIADLMNTGGRYGGAVNAAAFLEQFTGDKPWVHLDVAGTAWSERDSAHQLKGATGAMIRSIIALAENMSKEEGPAK